MKFYNSRKPKAFTLVELLIVIAIIAILLAVLVPTLNKVREQTRKVVCASNLKQIGLLLEFYCADNKAFYPPTYSGNYMNCAIVYDPTSDLPKSGLVLVLPYLFKGKGDYANDNEFYMDLKSQEGMERMKIFWCPSSNIKYDPIHWQGTVALSTGYVQYCSYDGQPRNLFGGARIGGQRKPLAGAVFLEHSPLKNVPHINGGIEDKDGNWIPYKSNTGWITWVDISTNGQPVEGLKSNHFGTEFRYDPKGGKGTRCMGAAGANALHVGGNVTWYGPKVMDFDSSKCFMTPLRPGSGLAYDNSSYWMFPRTE